MSNHVHLIISSKEGIKQEGIIRDFTKHTSKQLLKLMEENKQESRKVEVGTIETAAHYLYSSARDYAGINGVLKIEFIE